MTDIAIRAESLSKRFRLGQREPYKALRDTLTNAMYAPFRRVRAAVERSLPQPAHDRYVWALKDVAFEIGEGEVVGIIGRNGAGKSTLLKILSRITEPTEGYAEIHGRVGSLLEIGTGFHPELTGRENIYLNGAILGMKKAEIERKFDAIVDFAEIEKFLDTPVKHYSSGMHVRLAFAVAAHLETEILFVDEVLAVGDVAFQRKCLGKMGDVAKSGRTVLFVSHNMGAVKALCTRGLVLEDGRVAFQGDAESSVQRYLAAVLESGPPAASVSLADRRRRHSSDLARLESITLLNEAGLPSTIFRHNDPMYVRVRFRATQSLRVAVEIFLKGTSGEKIAAFASSHFHGILIESDPSQEMTVDLVIPKLPLARGRYVLDVALTIPFAQWLDYVEDACLFDVEVSDPGGTGFSYGQSHGFVYIEHDWKLAPALPSPENSRRGDPGSRR